MAEHLHVGDQPIHLAQVLKLAGWAETGGQAKALIAAGRVRVNGMIEQRKRRQMAVGDQVQMDAEGPTLILVAAAARSGGDDLPPPA